MTVFIPRALYFISKEEFILHEIANNFENYSMRG
jgi:hypothetical protein